MSAFAPILLPPWCRLLFTLPVLFLPGGADAQFVPDTRIEHSPPTIFQQGERIRLQARMTDPNGLSEARCYFRYETNAPYLFVEMNQIAQGYECRLPVPAPHIRQIEYLLVAVNSLAHAIKTEIFHIAPAGEAEGGPSLPFAGSGQAIALQSDIPFSQDIVKGFALTDQPICTVVPAPKRFGLRVGIYDMSADPVYAVGFFGGFTIDLSNQLISSVRGFVDFSTPPATAEGALPDSANIAAGYPDINGTNWSGYFYVVNRSGTPISAKTHVTASVYHNGSGSVSIQILSNRGCPGRDSYSRGSMNTSGYILIYDDCDGEDWTTHWTVATSTHLQILDYIDPPYYQKLNIVDLTRPNPIPTPAAPVLISPPDGARTNFRETLLAWNAANYAVGYQMQRGSTCDTGIVQETAALNSTLIDIEPNTVNYWKVRGKNSLGVWGPWSACWSFKTRPNCPACPAINVLLFEE